MIRPVAPSDAAAIAEIYNYYVENTAITFELDRVSEREMLSRIEAISSGYPYLVYEEDGKVAGYCYLHAWKEKAAYSRTAETTIYIHRERQRCGAGKALMSSLIAAARDAGFHALVACITSPDGEQSIKFHRQLGFEQASEFREVGYKFGRWIGIVDYILLLN